MFQQFDVSRKIFLVVLGMLMVGCVPSTALPSGANAEWDLLVIGDSSFWELGKAYELQIEKDQGVQVVLEEFVLPELSAGRVREVLETGKSPNARLEDLPDAVRKAEVIVLFVNPKDSIDPAKPMNFADCFQDGKPIGGCSLEKFEQYTEDLKGIWAKIIELRGGQATILRATDIANPRVNRWNQANVFAECNPCWENMSSSARLAAEAYNIPFVSRYDSFNGAVHTTDIQSQGYVISDGVHPSELAGVEAARLLNSLGYEPVSPPP